MKLHERHEPVSLASCELHTAVLESVKRHRLSFAELASILASVLTSWAKYEVRDERQTFTFNPSLSARESGEPLFEGFIACGLSGDQAQLLAKRLDNYGPWSVEAGE